MKRGVLSCDALFVLQKDSGKNSSDYRVAALTPSVKTTL
jgi:hypothetical protein